MLELLLSPLTNDCQSTLREKSIASIIWNGIQLEELFTSRVERSALVDWRETRCVCI